MGIPHSRRRARRAALVGAVVGAVVMLAFPVIAAVGGNMILGKLNTADATTFLSGSAPNSNLRIINQQAGAPALDLRVVAGSPPLQVNSGAWVRWLNADRLDGKHAGAFALAGHNHDAAYLAIDGRADDSDLLDGLDSAAFAGAGHGHDGTYSPLGHNHDAAYLAIDGRADDSDLLDGLDSAAFAGAGHNHDGTYSPLGHNHDAAYLAIDGKADDSDLLDGHDSSSFAGAAMACPPGTLVGYGRTGPVCSGTVGSVILDEIGDVGYFSSLVLDASGFPVIAYYDDTNGHLRLVHCGDATCSRGNTITTADGNVPTGRDASLMLDASGYPVISYSVWHGGGFGELKLVHCGDATCSSGSTSTTLSDITVGRWTSLALDSSGRPVISYESYFDDDLIVVRCGDANCSS
ncbi:MAG: hypothetical protein FJW79_06825, partial [Actinobacteria bacterium]|nr:hypothetical protein [Actinomycetota bacterium]